MSADNDLILRAAALGRAAPAQWRDFLAEFRRFADARKEELVLAPIEGLQIAQGRAAATRHLAILFENAVQNADRISNGRK